MPTINDVQDWNGRHMVGPDDEKLGKIDGIYVDDHTGEPVWASIHTGLFGRRSSFVQITDAHRHGDDVHVPYDAKTVKDAPNVDPDGHLSPEEEAELYRFYGRTDYHQDAPHPPAAPTDRQSEGPDTRPSERPATSATSGGSPAQTDDSVVLSEEQVNVTTRELPATKVRMRKYTVTEEVTITVPVTREEVRLEEVPAGAPDLDPSEIPDTDASGAAILRSEVPVVETRSVETERVHLGKDTITEDVEVTERLRREEVDVDHDPPRRQQP